jgi:hypothetical protein
MKYRPKHPKLNMVCAAIVALSGIVMMFFAFILPYDRSERSRLTYRTTRGFLLTYGSAVAVFGGYGVYYHCKYFAEERRKRLKKTSDTSFEG